MDSHKVVRGVIPNAVPDSLIQELILLQRMLGMRGYRPNTIATPLNCIITSPRAFLAFPLIKAREIIRNKIDDMIDSSTSGTRYPYCEFTSMLTWLPGSEIGWHFDSNREYLKQRKLSAVLYLNSDFSGGTFHYQDDVTIEPEAGKLIFYTSGQENIHRVDKIVDGERHTLTLWLTDELEHSEDNKLIQQYSLCEATSTSIPDELYILDDGVSDQRMSKLTQMGFHYDNHTNMLHFGDREHVHCKDINSAIQLAILYSVYECKINFEKLQQKMEAHNIFLSQCAKECSSCWAEMMEFYIPEKFANISLIPIEK